MSGCGCGCSDAVKGAGDPSRQVLEMLARSAVPCGTKDIVESTGLDKKIVSNQITALKKPGLVDSPVRCRYGITAEGKASLG